MLEFRLFTLRQASNVLQIDVQDVRRLLRDGYLRGYKIRGAWRISPDELNAFVEKYGTTPLNQLRPKSSTSQVNNSHLRSDGPQGCEDAPSTDKTTTNNDRKPINNNSPQPGPKSSVLVPPWRQYD